MAKLKEYKRKRNFKKTTEPKAKVASSRHGRRFVVHKHAATRLHYDFRLEHNGVLLSWAIPKGPSMVAGEKRLAVHVEDHPLDYASFEGTISEGEYGGGTVMLWDDGQWEPQGDPDAGLKKGRLEFSLRGRKLKGAWLLTRMRRTDSAGKENWLLIKRHDDQARSADDPDILEQKPRSVTSKRTLDQIATDADGQVWNSDRPESKTSSKRKSGGRSKKSSSRRETRNAVNAGEVQGARKAAIPKSLRPQLATLAEGVPAGDDWAHEIKFDGYRLLCIIEDGKARLMTRNGQNWTKKVPSLAAAAEQLLLTDAILDGELIAPGPDGVSDFQKLQNALKRGGTDLVYYAFDLPYCEGYDLSRSPLLERKQLLQQILQATPSEPDIQYCDHIRGNGQAVFDNACRLGMEGIISKRVDSPYVQKRSRFWLKIKCIKRQEFVIGGWTDPAGTRSEFGSLLLGYYDGHKLTYAGRVGTGFDEKLLHEIKKRMAPLSEKDSPFVNLREKRGVARHAHWIRPELVAEVEFTEWTDDGMLRHPVFHGLREDKPPRQVVREQAAANRSAEHEAVHSSVTLTNPARILYPEQGITKQQLADFYTTIAEWALPHTIDRPLALVRCPRGHQSKCFFQKHVSQGMPKSVHGVAIREKQGVEQTVLIRDLDGLIGLVQMGVLEIHLWGSRADNVEKPDRIVFDLDPGPDVPWEQVNDAARLVRDYLGNLGLVSFVKTSGGKGLHVLAPITRRPSWDDVNAFAGAIVKDISREYPDQYVAVMNKAKRHGRIFIDYHRNGRGATSVAPYSTRARAGAPVSTPIAWNELSADLTPNAFTVDNLAQRLSKLKKDPWQDFFKVRQSITAKMRRAVGE